MDYKCTKITIIGNTSFSIQGINLREQIESIVKKDNLDIKGKVLNVKDGRVIVICTGADIDQLYNKLNDLKNSHEDYIDIKNIIKSDFIVDEQFDDFKVERSDDQSEMIWALKGAGYRFVSSIETLREIHKSIIDRDKRIEGARLLSLHYELIYNDRLFSNLDFIKNPINFTKISTVAMNANIINPPTYDTTIIEPLIALLFEIQEKELSIGDKQQEILNSLKDSNKSLSCRVIKSLKEKYNITL